ncbi:CDP-glucose 4,6-dehydratase [bacterium SCSIO 12741]|nr:CDP-glucose 4,6-dehydratase [bacterium SCSIO 12741]
MESLVMQSLFGGVYTGKTVLVTGHNGFKGSWLSLWLEKLGAEVHGFSLENYANADHFDRLQVNCHNHYGDIRNAASIKQVVDSVKPDVIFHLAAQPLVLDSYDDPIYTYESNVMGTLHVLEAARHCDSVRALVNVTTDKVYENHEKHHYYKETNALGGYDPYSSSKACSEILSSSFRRSFLENHACLLATARAGNVIGGGDWSKNRLIPDVFKAIKNGETLSIRNPGAVRPWQHVLEPISIYLELGRKLLEGDQGFASAWNIGPQQEDCISVGDILKQIMARTTGEVNVEFAPNPTAHEANLLMLDIDKVKNELSWEPIWNIEEAVNRTADWYLNFIQSGELSTESDLMAYIDDASKRKLSWLS